MSEQGCLARRSWDGSPFSRRHTRHGPSSTRSTRRLRRSFRRRRCASSWRAKARSPAPGTPDQLSKHLKGEIDRLAKIVKGFGAAGRYFEHGAIQLEVHFKEESDVADNHKHHPRPGTCRFTSPHGRASLSPEVLEAARARWSISSRSRRGLRRRAGEAGARRHPRVVRAGATHALPRRPHHASARRLANGTMAQCDE